MMTRRELLRFAVLLPAGAWLSRFQTLAEPELGKIRITNIWAMKLSRSNCLIRIDTDAGISGLWRSGHQWTHGESQN